MKILLSILAAITAVGCQQPLSILVSIENIPATSKSVRIIATHGETASISDPPPFDLPQPNQASSTLLLVLPTGFSGDIAVSVGAFTATGGSGCLVATGSTVNPMFAGPSDNMRVQLMSSTDTACTSAPVTLDAVSPALGSINGGETITLTGWGYKPGAKVLFGTTAARSVTYVSAAQLKVVTPAKAGFGATPIRVTNADSRTASRSDLFKFYADTIDFTPLPFTATGDYSNANGFIFGVFDKSTTLDSAVAQQSSDIVRILLVTGTLTSTVDYELPVGSKPTGITAADFNKDGNLDVAVTTEGDSSVRILLNDGKGNLTQSGINPVGMTPESIATADLDGDGNADLVVANRGIGTMTILLGDGMGGFKSQTSVGSIFDPASVAIGDLNADGAPDIAIANTANGSVSIFFNDMGKFGGAGRYSKITLPLGQNITTVIIKDINNEGTPDIVAADSAMNQVVVVQNMGLPNVIQYTMPTEASPRAVQAGDLNGDGYPDLVVPCNTPSTANVFLNSGGAGFKNVIFQSVSVQCMNPVQAEIYDIDRDGRLDIGMPCQVGIGLLINHSGL